MLDKDAFIDEWRRLMGQGMALTEENVLTYVNRRDEMRRLTTEPATTAHRTNSSAAALPPSAVDLLKEIDWCLENGQQGMRSRAALAAAAMTLSGGRAMTSEERVKLRALADRHRSAQDEQNSAETLGRLERYVAALLSFRISPNADVETPALDT